MSRRSPLASLRRDRPLQAVLAVTALALAARLALLGTRVAHQDEARVGYWTLRYALTGKWEYRAIVHGPFIPILNRHLFSLLGASDFSARLVIALVGAAAPLAALLFRERLRDSEVVALALLLAANPVLLYYSRFMRQDVPLAVFMLFAFGFAVRAVDAAEFTTRRWYVLLSGLAFSLAFTTKENALLYPVSWLGAGALVFDTRLLSVGADPARETPLGAVWRWVEGVGRWRVGGAVAFLACNPLVAWLFGVPGQGAGTLGRIAFVALLAGGLLGYVLAVESPNPLHFSAALPAGVVVLSAVFGALAPGAGGPVVDQLAYVYVDVLPWYTVSWLLAGVLALDVAVLSHDRIRTTGAVREEVGLADTPGPDGDRTDRSPAGGDARESPEPRGDGAGQADGSGDADTGDDEADGDDSAPDDPQETDPGDAEDGSDDSGRADTDGDGTDGDDPDDPVPDGGTPAGGSPGPVASLTRWLRDGEWFLPPMLAVYALFFAVVILFYAPRGGGYRVAPGATSGWGLWSALLAGNLEGIAAVGWEATVGTWVEFAGTWAGGHQDHPYIPFFADFVKTLYAGALTLSVAAVGGVLADRYGRVGPRDLVQFAAYWGVSAVVGYPLVTDIKAPWSTVHAVVPLAIPAAVGIALVYRKGAASLAADRPRRVGVALLLLTAAVGQVGYAAADGVYLNPQSKDNELVQYAQSASTDLKPVLADVRSVSRDNDGVDLLYYGGDLDNDEEANNDQPYGGSGWFDRLPIAWYTESYAYEWRDQRAEMVVESTSDPVSVKQSDAPVVVTLGAFGGDGVECSAAAIEPHLEGYRKYCGHRYLYDSGTISTIIVYVDASRVEDPADVYRTVVGRASN